MQIEHNIPLPAARRNVSKYPFGEMNVGDSFFCTAEERKKVSAAASGFGRYHDMKFVTRLEGDGVRCWRTA